MQESKKIVNTAGSKLAVSSLLSQSNVTEHTTFITRLNILYVEMYCDLTK